MDLISNYESLFPDLISKKIKETESLNNSIRKMPIRKRTKPIDQRVSRSQMQKNYAETQASFKALRQAQDQTLGAGAGIPIVPEKEKKDDKPVTAPIVTTQVTSTVHPSTSSPANDPELPTPLSTRVLGGGLNNTAITEEPKDSLTIERTASPAAVSAGGSSTYGSAQGDSSPLVLSPEVKPTTPSSVVETPSITSTTTSTEQFDQDKPLSNVARLSRQFGSSSSGGGVRGPRPAGARAGRVNATEGTTGAGAGAGAEVDNKRDSKDLRPDVE